MNGLLPFFLATTMAASSPSQPIGEPVLEAPTLHCLGAYWIIRGDENENARVQVAYRPAGEGEWKPALDMLRVMKGHTRQKNHTPEVDPPKDAWLFAGSVFNLHPGTRYELKLTLVDPDGQREERILQARTSVEPKKPGQARILHVTPGHGGGTGTDADPYQGLAAADDAAEPGDLILLHKGIYNETLNVATSGADDRPILWCGAGDGEAVIDGRAKARYGIRAWQVRNVWFENLTIRGARVGISANDSQRIVIRRCNIQTQLYGINFNSNETGKTEGFFVTDNVIEGPSTWPRAKGIEDARGIQATGRGHVIAYNRIRGFADGVDTYPSTVCAAIDIHNNDISECTDDGTEMDFSERNTRCFNNRFTNVFQGISFQPVFGGPAYAFCNTLYNVQVETFKLHHNGGATSPMDWAPSGAYLMHNTSVKQGMPLLLWTPATVYNCFSRNNLFVGTEGKCAYENMAPMVHCDYDYDGFCGDPWDDFLKWNGKYYRSIWDVREDAPVYRHIVRVQAASAPADAVEVAQSRPATSRQATTQPAWSPFASGVLPPEDHRKQAKWDIDLRLKEDSTAIDAGQVLPNVNDGYKGKAPDLGAFELDDELPQYGPRAVR